MWLKTFPCPPTHSSAHPFLCQPIPLPTHSSANPFLCQPIPLPTHSFAQLPGSPENGRNAFPESPHAGSYCPLLEEMGSKSNTHHFPEENGRNSSSHHYRNGDGLVPALPLS